MNDEDKRHDDLEFNPALEPKSSRRGSTCWRKRRRRSTTGTTTATTSTSGSPRSSACAAWRATANFKCSGPIGGAQAEHLRQAADPGRGAEVQGSAAGVPGRLRADGALLRGRVRHRAHQRVDAAGARRRRADRARRCLVPLRERGRQGQLLRLREGLHRPQEPPRLPALVSPLLARGDLGRGGELPDARAGARALPAIQLATPTRRPSTRSTATPRRSAARDNRERAKFWEIWHKNDKRVVWVAEGCEDILDEDEPHLQLRASSRARKPAYATVQRGSLIPVPEVLQYRDQLDEVNVLTGAHSRAERGAGGEGVLSGRRRRDGRGDRDGDQDEYAGHRSWCRSATGRRLAAPRTPSSGCRST